MRREGRSPGRGRGDRPRRGAGPGPGRAGDAAGARDGHADRSRSAVPGRPGRAPSAKPERGPARGPETGARPPRPGRESRHAAAPRERQGLRAPGAAIPSAGPVPPRRAPAPPPRPPVPAVRGELLFGLHSVQEALRAGRRRIHRLWRVAREGAGDAVTELEALARAAGAPVESLERETLRALLGSAAERAQGVALDAGPLPDVPLHDLCAGERGRRLLVALDGVEDPQNVGAIARVADAAGVGGLVLPGRRSAPLSPAVSRASAGAIEWLPASRVGNLSQALEILKGEGFWTIGAESDAADDLFALPDRVVEGDLVLVLGAEGRGLRPGTRGHLDHLARIPMAGRVASLNVSAAAAVVLFELGRRRRAGAAATPPG